MPNLSRCLIVGVVGLVALPSILSSRTAPQSGVTNAPANLSGLWERLRPQTRVETPSGPRTIQSWGFGPGGEEQPPLQPWAMEKYVAVRKGAATHRGPGDRGDEALDPAMYCIPEGFPRIYTHPGPFEIVQLADRVIMFFRTYYQARQIYLDGRKHPDFGPTFMGHAIGRWDGDTLVTDTVGLKGGELTWLDTLGTPHSDELHIVERIRRPTHETLEIDFLFEDPKAFTRPWEGKRKFSLAPADEELMEFVLCETPKGLGGTGFYSK